MSGSHRPSVLGKRYVVSSVHYLATMGGVRILENGGNAADAGVAVGICINVLQPGSTHFGGVAPIIYCPGSGAPVETISGLGRWPTGGKHRLLPKISRRRPSPRNFANPYTGIARCLVDGIGAVWHHDL